MPDQLIGRRTALKYFGMLATLPAAQEFLKKWLTKASAASNPQAGHGLHAPPAAGSEASSSYVPQFFKRDEFETIGNLTEMIIPTDSEPGDRKSTRLNSSHVSISYAVFCLKKKKK